MEHPCEAPVMTATFWLYAVVVHLLEELESEAATDPRHTTETIRPVTRVPPRARRRFHGADR
jgi:hypothetical protein